MKNELKKTKAYQRQEVTDDSKVVTEIRTLKRSPESPPSENVLEILKQARLKKGKDILEASEALRVSHYYIKAIEEGNKQNLPERVYTLGFLRSYARYLDIDPEMMVKLFKVQILGDPIKENLVFPKPVPEHSSPRDLILLVSATIAILGLGAWYYFVHSDKKDTSEISAQTSIQKIIENEGAQETATEENIVSSQETETVPLEEPQGETVRTGEPSLRTDENFSENKAVQAAPVPATESTTVAEIPAPEKKTAAVVEPVKLEFKGEAWVELKTKEGKTLLRKTFYPGETYVIQPQEGLQLHTGNAGAIKIFWPGKEGKVLGNIREVKRISLDSK
jgi:cytoskeletal protein RodZ